MREILFRGKRVDNGEWVLSGNIIHFNDENTEKLYYIPKANSENVCIHDNNDNILSIEKGTFYRVIPETVGQYTGVTDKNGIKIFEGDIIQTKKTGLKGEKNYRFVIKYGRYTPLEYCKEIYSQWQTIGFYAFDGKREYQLSCCEDMLEVIGNIYDNPELLRSDTK